ncbi:MAG: methyltransferase domain-containing protein, partial [Anaerolineales bacterium]
MKHHTYTPSEWHHRYQIQAKWTDAVRSRLFTMSGLPTAGRILEVGSGTGVITGEISTRFRGSTFGLDIDPQANAFATASDPQTCYVTGDGERLPFPEATFDTTLCHFLLMWVPDPGKIISEMSRVTLPGGWVLALAEPDYGGRIDYPKELAEIGELQTKAMANQGSDPYIGRKMRDIFTRAGLLDVLVGVLGGEWTGSPSEEELDSEWRTLGSDLQGTLSNQALA